MTLAVGTNRIESERLVLRRITRDDYEFFVRIHAMPEVGRYIGGPRSAESSRAWIERTLALYESLNLGQLAVVRKSDGQLIGRCGLTELLVDANAAPGTIPRGRFGREGAPAGIEPVLLAELSYTFDPRVGVRGTRPRLRVACSSTHGRICRARVSCRSFILTTHGRYALPRDVVCGMTGNSHSRRTYWANMCGRSGEQPNFAVHPPGARVARAGG
jgi:hypothetical protein